MKVKLIGAPTCAGTGTPGCEFGPSAIENSLQKFEFIMLDHKEGEQTNEGNVRNFTDVMAWCALINAEALKTFMERKVPALIGGDHSLAIGSISAASMHAKKNIHVLWFDAHGDINSARTSPTGNMHGMPVQFLMTMGHLRPDQITYFGLRSLDPGEVQFLKNLGIKHFSSTDCMDRVGELIAKTMQQIHEDTHVHVSFDMDYFDPGVAPGVGTPEQGGPYDVTLEWLNEITRVNSFDVVELNPVLDSEQTVELACHVVRKLSEKSCIKRT